MNTTEKGNKLEDRLYEYLVMQQEEQKEVYDLYPPALCRIYKKKNYYSRDRTGDVEIDVSVELFRKGKSERHTILVFECKNHKSPIQERDIRDFSHKLGDMFPHASKGVIVTSSGLQSGAKSVAVNNKIGIVKFNEHGFEAIAERKGSSFLEKRFIETQIIENQSPTKSLKFSAFYEGRFLASFGHLLQQMNGTLPAENSGEPKYRRLRTPFLSKDQIKQNAQETLKQIDYRSGNVDLKKICLKLAIELQISDDVVQNDAGEFILGTANFERKVIQINHHENKQRQRFTIAHEIGHFCLNHDQYLRSEAIVERDLFTDSPVEGSFNYEWLEFHANEFASELLLPINIFKGVAVLFCKDLNIRNRGFGLYVDDQPVNYKAYNRLLEKMSSYFDVSKQAIEIKFKKLGWLNDQRKKMKEASISHIIDHINPFEQG